MDWHMARFGCNPGLQLDPRWVPWPSRWVTAYPTAGSSCNPKWVRSWPQILWVTAWPWIPAMALTLKRIPRMAEGMGWVVTVWWVRRDVIKCFSLSVFWCFYVRCHFDWRLQKGYFKDELDWSFSLSCIIKNLSIPNLLIKKWFYFSWMLGVEKRNREIIFKW